MIPSGKDASVGAKLALQNARRHLRAAEVLSKKKLYGPASTLVVLSIEELAKSWMLMLHSMGLKFPPELLSEVLSKHGARHAITFGAVFVFMIRYLVSRTTRRVQKRHRVKGYPPHLRDEWVAELTREFQSLASRSPKDEPVLAVLEWIGKANETKNRGLYVDFDGTRWRHPGQVSARWFAVGYDIAEGLILRFGHEIRTSLRLGLQADDQINTFLHEQFKKMEGRTPEEVLSGLAEVTLRPPSV